MKIEKLALGMGDISQKFIIHRINKIIEQVNKHDVDLIRIERDGKLENKEEEQELKGCPFCGYKPVYILINEDLHVLKCNFCEAEISSIKVYGSSKERTIEKWNKRA